MEATTTVTSSVIFEFAQEMASLNLGYLTLCVSIILFAGGLFYVFNFLPFKEKLKEHQDNLEKLQKQFDDTLRESLDLSKTELREEMNGRMKEQSSMLIKTFDQKEETISSNFTAQLAILEKDLNQDVSEQIEKSTKDILVLTTSQSSNQIQKLDKEITEKITKLDARVEKYLKDLEKTDVSHENSLKEQMRRIKELELFKFSEKEQMGAIYRSLDLVETALENKEEFRIGGYLQALHKAVDGFVFKKQDCERIEQTLKKLDGKPSHSDAVKKIRDVLVEDKDEE